MLSFATGSLLRLFALPTIAFLALRAFSHLAASLAGSGSVLLSFLKADGDWISGVMYLGAILVAADLLVWGSGAWSVDSILQKRLQHSARS